MSINQTKLKDHFPMIRDREAIIADINGSVNLLEAIMLYLANAKSFSLTYALEQEG